MTASASVVGANSSKEINLGTNGDAPAATSKQMPSAKGTVVDLTPYEEISKLANEVSAEIEKEDAKKKNTNEKKGSDNKKNSKEAKEDPTKLNENKARSSNGKISSSHHDSVNYDEVYDQKDLKKAETDSTKRNEKKEAKVKLTKTEGEKITSSNKEKPQSSPVTEAQQEFKEMMSSDTSGERKKVLLDKAIIRERSIKNSFGLEKSTLSTEQQEFIEYQDPATSITRKNEVSQKMFFETAKYNAMHKLVEKPVEKSQEKVSSIEKEPVKMPSTPQEVKAENLDFDTDYQDFIMPMAKVIKVRFNNRGFSAIAGMLKDPGASTIENTIYPRDIPLIPSLQKYLGKIIDNTKLGGGSAISKIIDGSVEGKSAKELNKIEGSPFSKAAKAIKLSKLTGTVVFKHGYSVGPRFVDGDDVSRVTSIEGGLFGQIKHVGGTNTPKKALPIDAIDMLTGRFGKYFGYHIKSRESEAQKIGDGDRKLPDIRKPETILDGETVSLAYGAHSYKAAEFRGQVEFGAGTIGKFLKGGIYFEGSSNNKDLKKLTANIERNKETKHRHAYVTISRETKYDGTKKIGLILSATPAVNKSTSDKFDASSYYHATVGETNATGHVFGATVEIDLDAPGGQEAYDSIMKGGNFTEEMLQKNSENSFIKSSSTYVASITSSSKDFHTRAYIVGLKRTPMIAPKYGEKEQYGIGTKDQLKYQAKLEVMKAYIKPPTKDSLDTLKASETPGTTLDFFRTRNADTETRTSIKVVNTGENGNFASISTDNIDENGHASKRGSYKHAVVNKDKILDLIEKDIKLRSEGENTVFNNILVKRKSDGKILSGQEAIDHIKTLPFDRDLTDFDSDTFSMRVVGKDEENGKDVANFNRILREAVEMQDQTRYDDARKEVRRVVEQVRKDGFGMLKFGGPELISEKTYDINPKQNDQDYIAQFMEKDFSDGKLLNELEGLLSQPEMLDENGKIQTLPVDLVFIDVTPIKENKTWLQFAAFNTHEKVKREMKETGTTSVTD